MVVVLYLFEFLNLFQSFKRLSDESNIQCYCSQGRCITHVCQTVSVGTSSTNPMIFPHLLSKLRVNFVDLVEKGEQFIYCRR